MTAWNWPGTRHVPEDELHAYLDQALSRSQCVEIECHLAECRQCQRERDRVAAVRDRITSLLAEVQPVRVLVPPPFEVISARYQERRTARRISVGRITRIGLAAATLAAAVGAGWWTRGRLENRVADQQVPAVATAPAPTPAAAPLAAAPAPIAPAESRTLTAVNPVPSTATPNSQTARSGMPRERFRLTPAMAVMSEPAVQVTSLAAEDDVVPLDGLWQSVDLQEAVSATGGNIPRIDGLPVLDIQLQRGAGDERPTVMVAQRHPSGRIIQTIEGPVGQVSTLLDKELSRRPNRLKASNPAFTPPDYIVEGNQQPRRGIRVLTVTGNFSADSLNALARNIDLRD